MSIISKSWKRSSLFGCASLAAVAASMIGAQANATDADDPIQTIVVTGTNFNTDEAPAKASLETVEPQTIINRAYIQDFLPPGSDYVTILAIVPSMTGGDPNGPGLSDGGAKNTLRGLPDGSFTMQYDGIPFGDTNGPTHHNISYFPASTIGSAVVDRGPGNAGNLGASTYGGTVKLFSQTLTHDFQANAAASYGSFGTEVGIANLQSGDFDFNGTTRVLLNVQDLHSSGALSFQDVNTQNALLKVENEFAPNWKLTLFADYSSLNEHLDDNNGLTPAQVEVFGKNFALQTTNPNLPTFRDYNVTNKKTDFEYIRVNGDITTTLRLDNTAYTYYYNNQTLSPNSQTQTLAQIDAGTSGDNANLTGVNGQKFPNSILSYTKENEYRVFGDVLRLAQDFDFGWVSGELRTGVWLETQDTTRFKFFFDGNQCFNDNINPYTNFPNAVQQCGVIKGNNFVPGFGSAKDFEFSSWTQYQPFAEIDIKPTDDWVITPGIKYVHWDHKVDAPVEQGSLCGIDLACAGFNRLGQNFDASFVTRQALPFLQTNYKITNSWSVYAEYAKGIYVPDISSFEASSPTQVFPAAQTTTNYQVGTVFYSDNFTFDADVYYIPINNNFVSNPCTFDTTETCFVNSGRATYKGLEGEGTYAFDRIAGVDVRGLSIFANGALMSSKQGNGLWEENAPKWTAALGLLYKHDGWKFAVIDKIIGPQFEDQSNFKFYELSPYSDITLTAGYAFDRYEVSLNVDNLRNNRATTLITEAGATPQTNPATSLDQYFFQAPASVFLTLKAHY
jgi:iron complex outermembrane receptor protein